MDFLPSKEYKVKYTHKKGFYTYKQNFEVRIVSPHFFDPEGKRLRA